MIQASQGKKDSQHILPLDSFPIYSRKLSKKNSTVEKGESRAIVLPAAISLVSPRLWGSRRHRRLGRDLDFAKRCTYPCLLEVYLADYGCFFLLQSYRVDLCTGAAAASMDDDEVARMSSNTCGNRCIGDERFLSLKNQNCRFKNSVAICLDKMTETSLEHFFLDKINFRRRTIFASLTRR